MNLEEAAKEHCALFNASVRSGDWAPFIATFAPDAHLEFFNTPVGPFHGREAIAAAYAAQAPDDPLVVQSVKVLGADTARVRFAFGQGGPGTMTVRWRDAQVAELVIELDQRS